MGILSQFKTEDFFSSGANKALSIFPCKLFVSVGAIWKFAGLEWHMEFAKMQMTEKVRSTVE